MKLKLSAAAILVSTIITGCSSGSDSTGSTGYPHDLDKLQTLLDTNADLAFAAYSDAVDTAVELQTALADFKTDPSAANLQAAKDAWLVAREPYGQTEVYRFRNSPIDDDPDTAAADDGPEGEINAWPLGEALIDYVQSSTDDFDTDQIGVSAHSIAEVNGGAAIDRAHAVASPADNIIGSSVTIDEAMLSNTATADDEHDVIAGYHAIEFLLWGQDLNNTGDETNSADRSAAVKTHDASSAVVTDIGAGAGTRPLSDFNTSGGCTTGPAHAAAANDDPCTRRHTYLEVAAAKLVADLTFVRDHWDPAISGNYRESFTDVPDIATAKSRFLEILTGMGTLSEGELAGERIQIALSANSQEDEHSCFSDNTHRDIWLDAEGVSNSYTGSYAGYDSDLDGVDDVATNAVDGYGIAEYLADTGETTLAADIAAALATTEAAYQAIDANARNDLPVDVVIVDAGSSAAKPMRDTVVALNAQSALIAKIATTLELGTAEQVIDPDASACDTTDPLNVCP